MNHHLKASGYGIVISAVLVAAFAVSGCGKPKQSCVGLGCDGQVSVGLNEECVGMGCPPADAK